VQGGNDSELGSHSGYHLHDCQRKSPQGQEPTKAASTNPMRQDGDGRHKLTKENISILKGMAGKVE